MTNKKDIETMELPQDPRAREALIAGIEEIVKEMHQIGNSKQYIKDSVDALKDSTGANKKLIRQLANARFKHDLQEKVSSVESLASAYEELFEDN